MTGNIPPQMYAYAGDFSAICCPDAWVHFIPHTDDTVTRESSDDGIFQEADVVTTRQVVGTEIADQISGQLPRPVVCSLPAAQGFMVFRPVMETKMGNLLGSEGVEVAAAGCVGWRSLECEKGGGWRRSMWGIKIRDDRGSFMGEVERDEV